jgi:hypothetical protein
MNLSRAVGLIGAFLLTSCGPSFAPLNTPGRPCTEIGVAEFEAALAAGAARADARIAANGTVTINTGPGVVHCATFRSSARPCRRPNDFVIRYVLPDGAVTHVLVRANEQYRFRVMARPTNCEVVNED